MKRRTALLAVLVLACTAACFLLVQRLVANAPFDVVSHYGAASSPAFEQFQALSAARLGDVHSMAAWAKEGAQPLESECARAEVTLYRVAGDCAGLIPGRLIAGNAWDASGLLIDSGTAFSLFGSADVIGRQVVVGGEQLVVQAVFEMDRASAFLSAPELGVAFAPPARDGKLQAVGINFTPSAQYTSERVKKALSELGESDYTQDMAEDAWFLNVLSRLPIWVLLLSLLIALGSAFRKSARRFGLAAGVLCMAAYLALCAGILWGVGFPPALPAAWIPSRWSSFEHWGPLFSRLVFNWVNRPAPILPFEQVRRLDTLLSALSCAAALMVRIEMPWALRARNGVKS